MTVKQYLAEPPILASPKAGEKLYLYIIVSDVSINAALFKEDEYWKKMPILFVSKSMSEVEAQYTRLE